MKNFKLLLATTAMLSTLSPDSFATVSKGTNVTIKPTIDIITPVEVENTDLYFGILISPKKDQTVQIFNYTGTVSGSATLVSNAISQDTQNPSAGRLVISHGVDGQIGLTFPTSVTLKNGNVTCGKVTGIDVVGYHGDGRFSYGGTFTVAADGLEAGRCQGEGTITVIVDDDNRDYGLPRGGFN